ncbi:MAG TPA: phosphate ABC transporter substrate-binding protein PstS [Actinomycetota bacterium]|nr:phosphate ABC transporter substrate-binding protein PstS [Actinomycetota bacterium]
MRRAKLFVIVAAITGMVGVACSSSKTNATTTPTPNGSSSSTSAAIQPASSITGDGSTFVQPLYTKWGTDFNAVSHIQVAYTGTGSSQGIKDIIGKTVDFAGTDAPYVAPATQTATILNIPTALGAVAVIYNLPGVKTLQLSGQTLADIFQGKLSAWNNAEIKADNPGVTLPSTPITIVHRSDGSGTTYIFTTYLSTVSAAFKTAIGAGTGPTWPTSANFKAGAKSAGVDQVVKSTPGAIGYVELTYAVQTTTPAAAVQNGDRSAYVAPSVSTTAAAAANFDPSTLQPTNLVFNLLNAPGKDAYPIAGPTYALVYQKQDSGPKGEAVVQFLNYGLTTGQQSEAALYYVALPSALTTKCLAALKTVTFNGQPLLAG